MTSRHIKMPVHFQLQNILVDIETALCIQGLKIVSMFQHYQRILCNSGNREEDDKKCCHFGENSSAGKIIAVSTSSKIY